MSQNKRVRILSGALLLLLVGGVVTVIVVANRPFAEYNIISPTALPQFDPFIETQAAQQTLTDAALNPTATITPLPSSTTDTNYASCGWMWATQINPELSAQVQQQLIEVLTNVDTVEARAEAFGENCLNSDGSVRYFATMQTDFRVTAQIASLPVDNLPAAQIIVSPIVLDILRVLAHYPEGAEPMPGQISIQFPVRNKTYWLSVDYKTAMDALDQGLTDEALLDALGGLRS